MLNLSLALAVGLRAVLAASTAAPTAVAAAPIPAETPIHLGISLRIAHPEALAELQRAQQDPASPDYRKWITPEEFGERFGQPADVYAAAVAWLRSVGFVVKQSPNRTFVEATGQAGQVTRLLGVHLLRVDGKGVSVHVPDGKPRLPPALAPVILNISGLDTRVHFHHHISETDGNPATFGPQDLRRFYGLQPLLDQGFTGQGELTVVLSTAESAGNEASPADIEYFFENISDARAPFVQNVMPNPQNDVDPEAGGGLEFELDCEMQSVGSPGADAIILEISPASEVFTTGANDIVTNPVFLGATAASVSLGNCEQAEEQSAAGTTEAATLRQAIQQGAVQGMSFSAASGDNGSDDCQDGMTVAVDFPASIPEVVAAGGSQVNNPAWDANSALTAWQTEVVWQQLLNGTEGEGGGGGLSVLYPTPAYQLGLPGVTMRGVPDIALIAGLPGVTTCSGLPGQLEPVEGTSIASPLSAGILALISSSLGCHTGDPHVALYELGNAQFDGGGPAVYHDITMGTNALDGVAGETAGVGYDLASGWGSLNVAAMAAAWPGCPVEIPDGGAVDGGDAGSFDAGPSIPVDAGPPYNQCAFIECDAGCTTLPEGPSSCSPVCNATNPASCDVSGEICTSDVIYSDGGPDGPGACVPGCLQNSDCPTDGGTPICEACEEICIAPGNASANIGDGCESAADCPSGASCTTRRFDGGYCTEPCLPPGQPGASVCGCPTGSACVDYGRAGLDTTECFLSCSNPGEPCARPGYLCQPVPGAGGICLPACTLRTVSGTTTPLDTCTEIAGSTIACDLDSGYCGGPAAPDAGPAPTPDAGTPDAGTPPDAGQPVSDAGTSTPPAKSGCGCMPGAGSPDGFLALLALAGLVVRRRR